MRMRRDGVRAGESPGALSARLGVPVCMLLRANRLVCTAWLVPGREIDVPGADFCKADAFPCPARLVRCRAKEKTMEVCMAGRGESIASLARSMSTSERLLLLMRQKSGPLAEGERILLPAEICAKRIRSVLPGETPGQFCLRTGADWAQLLRLNRLEGDALWPGMRLVLPDAVSNREAGCIQRKEST